MRRKHFPLAVLIAALIIGFIVIYFIMPVWNFKFFTPWIICALIAILSASIVKQISTRDSERAGIASLIVFISCLIGFGILWLVFGFSPSAQRAAIGTVKELEFSDTVSPVDTGKLVVVDKDLAEKLADKKLGELGAIGSRAELGDFTLIKYKDDLVWVAPLKHRNLFSWLNYQEGTPGFITVSATTQEAKFVQEVNEKKVLIKYQPAAYLGDDLKRHLYFNGYSTVGLTDFSLELDEDGSPWWVVTKYTNDRLWNINKIIGVVIVDPATGDIKDYDMAHIPDWVDRVIPEDVAMKQLDWWGKYVHGLFNFAGTDKLKPTEGDTIIYSNGQAYYYTGMTSVSSDEALVGFALINTKTKETTFYRVPGAIETAGMKSANGAVQDFGYQATFPLLININDEPVYFMTLKDEQGLVKSYAIVSVTNYQVVGIGNTPALAKSAYLKKLSSSGSIINKDVKKESTSGIVERINFSVIDGNTLYYIKIQGDPKIYLVALTTNPKLPLTREGDKVTLEYYASDDNPINAVVFDNNSF